MIFGFSFFDLTENLALRTEEERPFFLEKRPLYRTNLQVVDYQWSG
jgi:hypothetical protein